MKTKTAAPPKFTLISGVGNYSDGTACVVSAAVAKWRFDHGKPLNGATDQMDCICPVIRRFAIGLNDNPWWESDQERTEALSPFIPLLAGTADPELLPLRAFLCADVAVRVFAPIALDAAGLTEQASKLRALPEIKTAAAAAADAAARKLSKKEEREARVAVRTIAIETLARL